MNQIIEQTIERMGIQIGDAVLAMQGTGIMVLIAGLAFLFGARCWKAFKRWRARRKAKAELEKRFAQIVKKSKEEDRWLQR